MADCTPKKLTDLPEITLPLESTDLFLVVRPSGDPGNGLTYADLLTQIPAAGAVWGEITGVLSNQTDLQAVLDDQQNQISDKAPKGWILTSGLTMESGFLLGRTTAGQDAIEEITVGTGLAFSGGVLSATATAPLWGDIGGTLSNQADLQAALDAKYDASNPSNYIADIVGQDLSTADNSVSQFTTLAAVAGVGYVTTSQASPQTIGATGARLAKLWATDLTVTNAIAGSVTGNAATATALQTARAINGVNFDGTAPITVTAAAGTLTGTTLAATVVTSSLTAVGALGSGSLATGFVVGAVTMTLGSDANYDLYYRNSSGVLTRLGNGSTGQFLAATTGSAPTWGTPSGTGTVTHTGSLTSNAVVLGNGSADVTVVAGITTDGTSALILGVNTTTLGKVKMFGSTSGDVTIQPNAVAGTGIVLTLPATTTTLVGLTTTDTLTNKTLTSPVVNGLTSSGSTDIDFSGNSGSFKTTTGAVTLGSSATVNGVILAPEIQQNIQSGSYTLVLSDANKQIVATSGTGGWTIPANSSVAYPIGTTLVFIVNGAIASRTIAITTDTLTWAPTFGSGTRTLAAGGVATALKVASTQWFIFGCGLT